MKRVFWHFILATGFILTACESAKTDVDLPAPEEGKGFHFETGAIVVPAGNEYQWCYFFKVPGEVGSGPVHVNKIEMAMNAGSHHMNVFRVKTISGLDPEKGELQKAENGTGECYRASNWGDWPIVFNTQDDSGDLQSWTLPEGVVHTFEPGEWLMLQTHYVNATTQKTPYQGHVEINFYTTSESTVKNELGTLFTTKQSIRICKSSTTLSFDGSCNFNNSTPVTIIGANGHFHSRGRQFDMYSWDGVSTTRPAASDRFYRSTEWDHALMSRSPDLNLEVPANGGVWYTCDFEWIEPPADIGCEGVDADDVARNGTAPEDLDCCYTFGGVVEFQEHCNAFVYYYPKIDDIACF